MEFVLLNIKEPPRGIAPPTSIRSFDLQMACVIATSFSNAVKLQSNLWQARLPQ